MGSLLPMLESVHSISYLHVQAVMNSTPRDFFPSFKDLTTYMGMLTPGATELFGGGLIPP